MQQIVLRLSIAMLTFIVGSTVASIWNSTHYPNYKEIEHSVSSGIQLKQAPVSSQQSPEESIYTYERGLYSNYNFAYSVRIPKGLIGYRSPAPMPNHGFGIDLSQKEDSHVWVEANYNAGFWESFDDAIKFDLDVMNDKEISDLKLAQRTVTRLSGLRAVRYVIHYKRSGIPMIQETVLAFRKENEDVEFVYTIGLVTLASRYSKDRKVVDELQKTFRLESFPDY